MRRTVLGVLAVVFLAAGGIMYLTGYDEGMADQWQAIFLRMGTLAAAIWVAWPELGRMRPWLATLLLGALVVLVYFRRLLVPTLVVLAALAILRPRSPRKQ
jgi:hypothetical protein